MSDTEEEAGAVALVALPAADMLFQPATMSGVLASITVRVREHMPDVTSERGRKEIASLAMRVSKSKVLIDNTGAELVSEWKKKSGAVDKERKRARDILDALRDECRKPLTDYELAEGKALNEAEAAIAELVRQSGDTRLTSDEIGALMLRIMTEANDRKFGKHQGKFDEARNEALTKLSALLVTAREREYAQRVEAERQAARDAELAELRAKVAAMPVVPVREYTAEEKADWTPNVGPAIPTTGYGMVTSTTVDGVRTGLLVPDAPPAPAAQAPATTIEVALAALIEAIEDLADNSEGLTDLCDHQGQVPWKELMIGGRWESWLGVALEKARAALRGAA